MRLLRLPRLTWIAVGAAGAYLLDPENGSKRRANLSNQIAAKRRQSLGSSGDSTPSGPTGSLGDVTGISTTQSVPFTPS